MKIFWTERGAEKASREQPLSTKVDVSKNDRALKSEKMSPAKLTNQVSKERLNGIEVEGEEIDIMPKNKFRRYGLLANRISTRNIARKRRSKSSSSSSSSSSDDMTSPEKEIRAALMSKLDSIKAAGLKTKTNNKSRSKNKTDSLVYPSLSTTSVFNGTINPPLISDRIILPNPNLKRPRSPEIQFRPSDPSSYGIQTNTLPNCRSIGPNISGISSQYHNPFETVLIVDTSTTEPLANSPKRRTAPYKSPSPVQWTHDCSIEVFSVETLPKDGFSNESYLVASPSRQASLPLKKQSALIRAIEGDRNGHASMTKITSEYSPISVASSSTDVVIIDDDGGDNSSPPFLIRNSPPPKLIRNTVSPNRSPPSLQANLPPPPLLHCPTLLPCSSRTVIDVRSNTAVDDHPVITINSGGNSTSSIASCDDIREKNETGSKNDEYRKTKRDKFRQRRKFRYQMEKLRRSYQIERKGFLKRKSEEKKLQINYLRLKVEIKAMKLEMMKRKILAE